MGTGVSAPRRSPSRVHALASTEHYERHVRAVWEHLDPELQGMVLTGPQASGVHLPARDVLLVAGWADVVRGRHGQRVIYMEHGAGQSYGGDPRSAGSRGYAGNSHHPASVIGYLCPRADVAELWSKPAAVVGCPALDRWAEYLVPERELTVAITFHWDASRMSPEGGTAFAHYRNALPQLILRLRDQGFRILGHWHPRSPTMRATWTALGVRPVRDLDEVLEQAHLLIADNTSVMYEFAALDRPVLVLNCPQYRRHVEHGLRFWSHVPGTQIDEPDELLAMDLADYVRADPSAQVRRAAAAYCYGLPPGNCGAAAARWITELIT